MAYTTIDKPSDYFNTKLTTGTGNSQAVTGVGFQPDWIWGKRRDSSGNNSLFDAVRGITKGLESNSTGAEFTSTDYYSSFDSDGFTIAAGAGGAGNGSGQTAVQWCWKAGGTAPSKTYTVKVVSDGGNKYRFDDFGTSAVTLEISEGGTYTFDQSDSSNNGHPLRFATQADGANSSQYTTGVTTNGTPGQAGAYTRITVAASAPTLFYYCTNHTGMGGQANTPTTNSFSSFNGTIQSNISPNTTSGFSIVSYTGNGTAGATVGHGIDTPKMIIVKKRSGVSTWNVYHEAIGNTKGLYLNTTDATTTYTGFWNDTSPTSSVFSVGADNTTNSATYIAYCFAEKKGYSKFGSYTGNGNADGTFIYTGFKPAFFLCKDTGNSNDWVMFDNKRDPHNVVAEYLRPNLSNAASSSTNYMDFSSNGIKHRVNDTWNNGSGRNYIYMAFAENPFTSSAGTPVTAR